MSFKFLEDLKASITEQEFKEVLTIATQDIMFNNVGFNRLTKEQDLISVCEKSLILIRGRQACGKGM
ncbi:MAG: hypothetical protein RR948_08850 [Clostridium sp.]|uniref:hypothetical protein n=1 Tax=Clostridium sp. TaxID=1506 RepID=UPI0030715FE3